MSYTDYSVQRRLKSNAPIVYESSINVADERLSLLGQEYGTWFTPLLC